MYFAAWGAQGARGETEVDGARGGRCGSKGIKEGKDKSQETVDGVETQFGEEQFVPGSEGHFPDGS